MAARVAPGAPPGRALLCSIVIRDPPRLLPLVAGVAVAEAVRPGPTSRRGSWPNDVLVDGRKVAGILVEGRPQAGWAVPGIGLNVALRVSDFPPELRERAGTLGSRPMRSSRCWTSSWVTWGSGSSRRGFRVRAVRERDALLGRPVRWAGGSGIGAGVDEEGRLLVATETGTVALDAGEVHLVHSALHPSRIGGVARHAHQRIL